MATFDLGRVTPLYKGGYIASASYELNDVVLYNGNLYWHVQATATVGILPTDTTVWKLAFADEGVRAEIRGYADNAQNSADSALASKSAAAQSASQASASASQAALSAQTAQTAETGATASAQTASTKASEATASAQSAASSAQTATDKATLASQKAAAASESASLATAKASAAATSETNARTAAQTATAKASNAAASATSAQEYNESAQQSAVNAQTSATNAAASEAQAQEYAEQAEESAEALSDINERLQRQQGIIAEAFSAQSTYDVGDSVIYEAGLYTFRANKVAGAWDATKVDGPFKVTDQISSIKEDLDGFEKAKKDRVYLDGVVTSNAWKQNNLNEYSSTQALFLSADVIGGATYYISGVSINTSFPLAIFVDGNNTIIDILYTSDNTVSVDREIITPDNCAKIYINGRKWGFTANYHYPSIYRIAYDTDILDSIASDIKDKQSISYAWTDAETEVVEHAFVAIISGNIEIRANITASNSYTYHKLVYDNTKIYRFYGACNEATVPAVLCCDENDNIITVFGNTAGTVYKGEILADIPKNTKRIYSNGLSNFHKVEVAHERDVKSLVSEKIGVAFGDSITQGANTYIRNNITPYQDYPSVASELLGCKIYNGGLGGGAYSAGRSIDFVNVANCIVTGDYTSIIEGIDQYSLNQSAKIQYANIASLDFDDVDFITISYGTNDWNFGRTITEITTAMVNGISAILTAYPHLKIYVFTPIFRFNIADSGQNSDVYVNPTSGLTLPQVCEAIKTCANNLCLPCKDMYHESNINPYTKALYMGDDTHPNANGYAVMGEKVARFINSH